MDLQFVFEIMGCQIFRHILLVEYIFNDRFILNESDDNLCIMLISLSLLNVSNTHNVVF